MTARLDLESLRALKTIVELGGVTRAADRLALSQSAVSHKIRRLEQGIGCTLLRRQPGGGLLTEDGARLLSYADRILALHDEALDGIGRKALAGTVRLGLTEDTGSRDLTRILAGFARTYPSVSVTARVEQSLVIDRQLEDGGLDLAVMQVFADAVQPDDRVLQTEPLVWASAQDHRFDPGRPLPFIAFDEACFYRRWALDAAARTGRRLQIVLQCANSIGVCNAVSAGLGTAVIAKRHLRRDMTELADLPAPPVIAHIVRTRTGRSPPSVAALADSIIETIS